MKLKSKKGFSLVELIIVIAILGIIALIAVPNLTGIQKRSQVSADIRTAEQIGKAVRVWLTDASITKAIDREKELVNFTDYSTLTSASPKTYGSLEGYISLEYKPQSLLGGEYYVKLDGNKIYVAIATEPAGAIIDAPYYLNASGSPVAGVAYIEGSSLPAEPGT